MALECQTTRKVRTTKNRESVCGKIARGFCPYPELQIQNTKLRHSLDDLRTELRQSLGDLRRLKELKELVFIRFRGQERILWKEIAGPNMEVLVISDCPISTFSFKKGTMQVGTVLRDFTLSGTDITKIHIHGDVLPSLETLDLSGNRKLKKVENLPSTLLRLNLQGCSQLKTITSLSNLVDLKVLKANQCSVLETLNVEDLISLEEIQAEACWELKSIQGLSQRDRLKCLRISTDTRAIWNDICNFLASTSHQNLSTAFLSGTLAKSSALTCPYPRVYQVMGKIHSIAGKFNLKVVDVLFAGFSSKFHTKVEEFQSYGAILMCFLTVGSPNWCYFDVRFEASDDGVSVDEYKMVVKLGDSDESYFHIFMWTEECNMFSDHEKGYNNISVSRGSDCYDVETVGWIMMVDKDTKVSQVCKEIIIALS